uniref:BZIP domain-containing protein n=1 Tax=Fagus sylvatica TaxID=28930 RepID=A0A2N9GZF9_FAGSY
MSRQAHLPPRCPIQKKPIAGSIHDTVSHPLHINESYPRHYKSASQSSILEEQPAWLDDLLSDSDLNSKGIPHRRSVSDSIALLDSLADVFPSLTPHADDANIDVNETCSGLESACTYGPNSPRQKSNVTFTENAIVSALSEYVSQDPVPYIDESLCISAIPYSHSEGDDCHSIGELDTEKKAEKRHSGQRSRVRKLQYIAELESTVDVLQHRFSIASSIFNEIPLHGSYWELTRFYLIMQTLESELAVRVASLFQQRVALSMENCKLKQQVARLQQENLIMECQYQSLKKELERLKVAFTKSRSSKVSAYFGSSPAAESSRSEATWQMLDMGKLNIS